MYGERIFKLWLISLLHSLSVGAVKVRQSAPRAAAVPPPWPLAGHRAQCAPAAHVRVRAPPVFPRRGGKPSGRPLGAAARSAPPRRAGAAGALAAAASPGSPAPGRQAAPLAPPWHASTAPDGPEAAPCAGVAWTAGALVRVGGRHCAGRGKAPARAWCKWGGVREGPAVGRSLRSVRPPLAPALRAANGVRPAALSPSPPGEWQGVGPVRRRARPTRQSTRLSPACQRGQRNGQGSWPGCQLWLCRVASHG